MWSVSQGVIANWPIPVGPNTTPASFRSARAPISLLKPAMVYRFLPTSQSFSDGRVDRDPSTKYLPEGCIAMGPFEFGELRVFASHSNAYSYLFVPTRA